MKIVLLEGVEKVGSAGDQVEVADGFARNFLIPSRKAVAATSANIKSLDHLLRRNKDREDRLCRTAETLAGQIAALHCVIARRAGEQNRLFGAVTNQDIYTALVAQGLDIDRRKILLQEPIKALGSYTVPIRLHSGVIAELRLTVEHVRS
jgi:large subunit ribosomal protein L9